MNSEMIELFKELQSIINKYDVDNINGFHCLISGLSIDIKQTSDVITSDYINDRLYKADGSVVTVYDVITITN